MSKSPWFLPLAALCLTACVSKAPAPDPVPAPEAPVAAPAPEPAPAPAAVEAAPEAPAPTPPEFTRPEQTATGKYGVVVASERSLKDTEQWVKKIEGDGLKASVEAVEVKGTTWQRVMVGGLQSRADANAMVSYLTQHGIPGTWVTVKGGKTKSAKAAAPATPAAPAAPAEKVTPVTPMPAPAEPATAPEPATPPDADKPQN